MRTRSHGLRPEIVKTQARVLNLPLVTANAAWPNYESQFEKLLKAAKNDWNVDHVIFGDVFPDSHKQWAEEICDRAGLAAVEPLWGESTAELAEEFIADGGVARIVAVRENFLDEVWLGRELDREALNELRDLGLDPGGENGEFHTVVTCFPGGGEIALHKLGTLTHGGCYLLDLTLAHLPDGFVSRVRRALNWYIPRAGTFPMRRLLMPSLLVALLIAAAAPAFAAPTSTPTPVTARHAMVVTAQHLATLAGVKILREGGNAVDAAVAVGYAEAVVNPCCGNLGGGGFMTLHLANGKNLFLNFRQRAPLAATAGMYLEANGKVNHRESLRSFKAIDVPGTVMGLDTALARYGTMTRAQVMAPAIKLAKDGYVLEPGDAAIFSAAGARIEHHPVARKQFTIDGHLPRAGERLHQPVLAHTLEEIAKHGSSYFYDGPIARAIVKESQADGGLFTMKDFKQYSVEWLEPIRCNYRGYTIISAAPPSSGGITLCEILNVLSGWKKFPGYAFHSVPAVHDLVEAMRFAFADRNADLGDPDFVHNPTRKLLSAKHAAWIRSQIPPDRAVPSSQVRGGTVIRQGRHTTHYSIVDAKGNAVAVTYSLNSWFGTGYMAPGTGFLLSNGMNDFTAKPGVPNQYGLVQGTANAIAPGKRPLSSMSPTIVLKNGKVFMVTGTPGGSTIITTTLETILNVVDRGMNVAQAVDAPRIHQQWLPDVVFVEPHALTPKVKAKLEKMGYHFKTRRQWGSAEAIVVRPDGVLAGANDPHSPAGLAAGY